MKAADNMAKAARASYAAKHLKGNAAVAMLATFKEDAAQADADAIVAEAQNLIAQR